MALQAMWAHGHSATIELNKRGRGGVGFDAFKGGPQPGEDVNGIPWTAQVGLRVGWGVQYCCQDNSYYWFHFAIPTPVIKDNVRARFRQAMILYTAGNGVTLNAFHVWDGPNRVFARDGLVVGGANLSLINEKNSFRLPDQEVFWGVGISVLFYFADRGDVTLHTAGIDFEA